MSFLHTTSAIWQGNHSSSSGQLVQLPANLLEAFIPGYSTISHLLLNVFGFDITLIVTISFIVFALLRSVEFLKTQSFQLVIRYCTCSIQIDSDTDTYFWIMTWLAEHNIGKEAHNLIAIPPKKATKLPPEFGQLSLDPHRTAVPTSSYGRARKYQEYEPALGFSQHFWHQGRLFLWSRSREQRHFAGQYMPTSLIEGRLYCVGRTTVPMKVLIEEASIAYQKRKESKTGIRRPASQEQRKQGGYPWKMGITRPSRPLHTVVLEDAQKESIIADIREYMQPGTRKWYAERGIPYRRGYLFYGAPGTGKTSLSFALAGHFGLDVYCVSLAEASITEEDLIMLFDELPEQCLVLLEDVDSAGLVSRNHNIDSAWAEDNSNNMRAPPSRISLSGLLNVIDGIASQEGRVLIMSTNHIEALDSALLRPGRVDVRIHFELATKKQAEDLFLQAFKPMDTPVQKELDDDRNWDDLSKLALSFAAEIPDRTMSPAAIQGYLMNWKKSPKDAVANVKKWLLSEKEGNSTQTERKA